MLPGNRIDYSLEIYRATSTIDVIFERIRHYPDGDQKAPSAKDVVAYPKTVGGEVVLSVRDVTLGTDSSYPDGKCRLPQQVYFYLFVLLPA